MRWLRELVAWAVLMGAGAGAASGPPPAPAGEPNPALLIDVDPDPLVWTTLFTWYTEESFRCAAVQPQGGAFRSDDETHYQEYFALLRSHGVDVIAGIVTGFAGEEIEGAWAARNLLRAIPLMKDLGLRHVPYYDLAIRSYWRNGLERNELDFVQHPRLARQIRDDFARLADQFIFPAAGVIHQNEQLVSPWDADTFRSTQLFLQDRQGRLILDESNGAPRPVIGLYLSRVLRDDRDYSNLRRLFQHEIPRLFHERGLGRPALVIDELWWHRCFNERRVAAFGTTAVALTAFGPVSYGLGPATIGEWAEAFEGLYESCSQQLIESVATGRLHPGLAVWPGVLHNFDKTGYRNCDGRPHHAYPALTPDHWERMLRSGLANAAAFAAPDREPETTSRASVVWYTDEYYEGLAVCAAPDRYGVFSYPNHHGCDPLETLLRVRTELRSRPNP